MITTAIWLYVNFTQLKSKIERGTLLIKKNKKKTKPELDASGCEELANAIVLQACKDYRSAYIRYLRRYGLPDRTDPQLAELERFFRSDWYKTLTSVDGEYLMKRIQDEVKLQFKSSKSRSAILNSG